MRPPAPRFLFLAWLLTAAACLVAAAPATASRSQETILQDDPKLVYQDDIVRLERTLLVIKRLGIDTVRVAIFWHLVAPDPTSRKRPDFGRYGASYPGSYPEWRWQRYDRIVKLSAKHGLNVLFSITGPAPRWATPRRYPDVNNYRPSSRDYGDFVKAVGVRYSGFWPDQTIRTPVESGSPLPVDVEVQNPGEEQRTQTHVTYLPRVSRWSLWNEPNFPNWLLPQWRRKANGRFRQLSPHIYRKLVDRAWDGLTQSTHRNDLILLGETAPYGPRNRRRPGTNGLMSTPMFIREFYCLSGRYRPYRGFAARVRGCPTTRRQRRGFRASHPALFEATGWAHHPYSQQYKPTFRGKREDSAPLGSVRRVTKTLDRAQFRWGAQSENWPVWITEYGYQTLPPDPVRGVSWEHQATWMSWAEYLTFRNRRIGSFAQFLLVDDAPRAGFTDTVERWRTWQSGLITDDGRRKPAYREFQYPIHVSPRRASRNRIARVFGTFRPARNGTRLRGVIQFAPTGGDWRNLLVFETTNVRGYVLKRVLPRASGKVRIVWIDPETGYPVATRSRRIVRR